jgi:transposase
MGLARLLAIIIDPDDLRIPADARVCLEMLATQLNVVEEQVLENDWRRLSFALAQRRSMRPGHDRF